MPHDVQWVMTVLMLTNEPGVQHQLGRPIHDTAMFVLVCIAEEVCTSYDAFAEAFPVGVAFLRHLSRLQEEGFITAQEGGVFQLTALGRCAVDHWNRPGEPLRYKQEG